MCRAPSFLAAPGDGAKQERRESAALCIVGAGYAGICALDAASAYLKPGETVIVIDAKTTWGGQWVDQYGYVRLHQPYRTYTVADRPWATHKPRGHLATRLEVLSHLNDAAADASAKLRVVPLFGYWYAGHAAAKGSVELTARPTTADGGPVFHIAARRLIVATGFDVQLLSPLSLGCKAVRSVALSDERITAPAMAYDEAPVYLIGSGKAAMDCVLRLLADRKAAPRKIVMVCGSGT